MPLPCAVERAAIGPIAFPTCAAERRAIESLRRQVGDHRSISSSISPELTQKQIFISFRFSEAHQEALTLKAELERRGLSVFLSNVALGSVA
jgi:hypothetical protein